MDRLGKFQEVVLTALELLGEGTYGVPLREEVSRLLDRDVSVGALYTTLDRLEERGFVSSWEGEATPERGGRRKRHFRLEALGARALANERESSARLARISHGRLRHV